MKLENYNEFKRIYEMTDSLDNFHKLLKERNDIYNQHGWVLSKYILNGKIILTEVGHAVPLIDMSEVNMKGNKILPADVLENYSYSLAGGWLPKSHHVCELCNQGWDINNIHDVNYLNFSYKEYKLDEFVGKTYKDVKDFYSKQNDSFISEYSMFVFLYGTSSHPDNSAKYFRENQNKTVVEGDCVEFSSAKIHHTGCAKKQERKLERDYIDLLFREAGFNAYSLNELPNGYHSSDTTPWFQVNTPFCMFIIGKRKRAYNIELFNGRRECVFDYKEINFNELFSDQKDNTTVGDTYIHSWSKEDSIQYLKKIKEYLLNGL